MPSGMARAPPGTFPEMRAAGICSPARMASLLLLPASWSTEVTAPLTTTPSGTWMILNWSSLINWSMSDLAGRSTLVTTT